MITYKNKKGMDFANEHNRICKSCTSIISNEKYPRKIPCSDERRRKARIFAIEKLKKLYGDFHTMLVRCNPKGCSFIDAYNKQTGYRFQHALNGGEFYVDYLGYFVDGYDKERNIVIEYDEPHHYYKTGRLKPRDMKRMNEIKNYLHCRFLRYKEQTKELIEY